ncbi:hypothetical protein V1504DRAFT_280502 [Lipomyces starkeyi]
MHDDFGHRGIDGCSQRLKSRFWWPGMDRDIKQYIRTCDLCQRRTHHGKREEERHPTWTSTICEKSLHSRVLLWLPQQLQLRKTDGILKSGFTHLLAVMRLFLTRRASQFGAVNIAQQSIENLVEQMLLCPIEKNLIPLITIIGVTHRKRVAAPISIINLVSPLKT